EGEAPIEFAIKPGSGVKSSADQIAAAGVPLNPDLFHLLARFSGKSTRLKAGNYELKPGTSPLALIDQLVRGEFAQESLAIIEGWTFKQMRQAIDAHPKIRHDTAGLSDKELLAKISTDYKHPEGLFFPDTYLFAKGSSDLQIYKQAHALLQKRLEEAWNKRAPNVPYKTPYEALIMASIVEKETGQKSERNLIAAVFVNRLRLGMLLQTDPTVIYGMGDRFQGNIRKKDLETDTPYNTYTRPGLPPTPIALPGAESLAAALNPATSDVLYFVSRGNGTSEFSNNLADHNRAVNKYQR
ncbi:MAG TPA: endolytic transglycosylase MltG, partial [Noviherbaspirillum sp.]|nr:endolytic transglycosylase MltG [Noviherbaspirillum sp.]